MRFWSWDVRFWDCFWEIYKAMESYWVCFSRWELLRVRWVFYCSRAESWVLKWSVWWDNETNLWIEEKGT